MGKKQTKRRSWRKAAVKDVEEALEDERLVAKATNKALEPFVIDTVGSCDGLSATSRRAIARAKLFPPKGPNLGLSATEEAKIARAEGQLAAARAAKRRASANEQPEVFDLWAPPAPAAAAKLAAAREEAAASTVRRSAESRPASVPKTLHQKVSAAPAVLPAHEGQSMNPEASAFEDVACMAAARELQREREAEAMDRKLLPITHELRDVMGADAVKELDEAAKVNAYRASVYAEAGTADAEDENEDGEQVSVRRSKQLRIKSQAQRNKEKKRKHLDQKQARLRAQRKLEKSVGEVGAIMKEMKEQTQHLEGRKAYRREMRLKRNQLETAQGVVSQYRRLGRTKFIEEDVVVPDSEAASKGLRAIPLKGTTAVKERIASIMRRGLLPAPPEASRSEAVQRKSNLKRLKRSRKFVSPLLRDNLLLR